MLELQFSSSGRGEEAEEVEEALDHGGVALEGAARLG